MKYAAPPELSRQQETTAALDVLNSETSSSSPLQHAIPLAFHSTSLEA
jgi:hypothetical protein